jgi:hypothetical protein
VSKEAPKQHLFVSNRTIVVRSTTGGAIGFEKGRPTHVPRHMQAACMEKGIMPCDKDGNAVDPDQAPEVTAEVKILIAPEDPADRQKAITKAIEGVLGRNDSHDFTSGGTPHEKAVSAALGWRVDQKEVKLAFQKLRAQGQE